MLLLDQEAGDVADCDVCFCGGEFKIYQLFGKILTGFEVSSGIT